MIESPKLTEAMAASRETIDRHLSALAATVGRTETVGRATEVQEAVPIAVSVQ